MNTGRTFLNATTVDEFLDPNSLWQLTRGGTGGKSRQHHLKDNTIPFLLRLMTWRKLYLKERKIPFLLRLKTWKRLYLKKREIPFSLPSTTSQLPIQANCRLRRQNAREKTRTHRYVFHGLIMVSKYDSKMLFLLFLVKSSNFGCFFCWFTVCTDNISLIMFFLSFVALSFVFRMILEINRGKWTSKKKMWISKWKL